MNKTERYPNREGKQAPAFCLQNQRGEKVCLKDLRKEGRDILLFFYPKDMTPGCTIEAVDFSTALRKLRNRNVTVYGISKLGTQSKQKFIDKHNLKVDLLADEDLTVAEKYGVWREKNMYGKKVMGIARETFLIDSTTGKIRKHWQKVKPAEHIAEVLDFLDRGE